MWEVTSHPFMKPVFDDFVPFEVGLVSRIRLQRETFLASNLDEKKTRKKRGKGKKKSGPRLYAETQRVLNGLDPKTRAIVEGILSGKK